MITPQTDPSKFLSNSGMDELIKMKKKFVDYFNLPDRDSKKENPKPQYPIAKTSSGLLARVRQKILIVEATIDKDKNSVVGLKNNDKVTVNFAGTPEELTGVSIRRVSEYPNEKSEFGKPSYTVLLEWAKGPDFIQERVASLKKGEATFTVLDEADQSDNFIINGDPPRSKPAPPFDTLAAFGTAEAALTDYSEQAYDIIEGRQPPQSGREQKPVKEKIKVVVSDTGLKFRLPNHKYTTSDGKETYFPLARNPTVGDPNTIGFCSVTHYLDRESYDPQLPDLPINLNGNVDVDKVQRNPTDDHEGRHGTHVTGIITQNPLAGCEVIALKIFDFMGQGTLFDILCGFNYVFARLNAGENIRIVNASWAGHVSIHYRSLFRLLEKKVAVLQEKKVFLIASAGNRDSLLDDIGTDISVEQMIPACYSVDYDNVITVTSVVETWRKMPKGFRYRARNLTEHILKLLHGTVPDGYLPVENFSATYVQVGVVAYPIGGFFPTPFGGGEKLPIVGSSFAAAYMSAYVVQRLNEDSETTRAQILSSLKAHHSLYPYIRQGRYLELDTVTGKSLEENFEPIARALLSPR
jgi:hypothetical protein